MINMKYKKDEEIILFAYLRMLRFFLISIKRREK